MSRYVVDPERSTVVVSARTSAGRVNWQTATIDGWVDTDAEVGIGPAPSGSLTVDLRTLASGNRVYDAELSRRLDLRRYPTATIDLVAVRGGDGSTFELDGTVGLHDRRCPVSGKLTVEMEDGVMQATGSHLIDMRDFGIPIPSILRMKVMPDVDVAMFVVAARSTTTED